MSFIVGIIAKKDLGALIRLNYSPNMKIFIWLTQELAIIAADI